jgi:hypothetical protein
MCVSKCVSERVETESRRGQQSRSAAASVGATAAAI